MDKLKSCKKCGRDGNVERLNRKFKIYCVNPNYKHETEFFNRKKDAITAWNKGIFYEKN